MELERKDVETLIEKALEEDLDDWGDITTLGTIPADLQSEAVIVAKQDGVVAGLPIVRWVYEKLGGPVRVDAQVQDGDYVQAGVEVVRLRGNTRALLVGERTLLNFLGRLSGIATFANRFVRAIEGTRAKILDTRKTLPGWRRLEKYAVRCGGAQNHRMGLWDMVLIKDNHIAAAGSIEAAVERVRAYLTRSGIQAEIEVEATTLTQVRECLGAGVSRILLDNMTLEELREAVRTVAGRAKLEASGNVRLETVREIAETGVDFISVGAITHSAPVFDFSMRFVAVR